MDDTTVPDFWQYSANPDHRNAWLVQENARLRAEIERGKESYQGLLHISKEWERKWRNASRAHDETIRTSTIDGMKRAHDYLYREFSPSRVPSKYRREGAQMVLRFLAEFITTHNGDTNA